MVGGEDGGLGLHPHHSPELVPEGVSSEQVDQEVGGSIEHLRGRWILVILSLFVRICAEFTWNDIPSKRGLFLQL